MWAVASIKGIILLQIPIMICLMLIYKTSMCIDVLQLNTQDNTTVQKSFG